MKIIYGNPGSLNHKQIINSDFTRNKATIDEHHLNEKNKKER